MLREEFKFTMWIILLKIDLECLIHTLMKYIFLLRRNF